MKNLLPIDYQVLFENIPGRYLILSKDLTIIEVSHAYNQATLTTREIIGRKLFEVFPDNPSDKNADGVRNLSKSLNFVLRHGVPHTMAIQKYDVRNAKGEFEEKYWSPQNKPVFNANGELLFIIHRAEDVTDFIKLQDEKLQTDIATDELKNYVKQMEIEIIKRSREIQQINDHLDQKVTERTNHLREANETIRKNIEILTSQKKQLEDFCNIISHNLRAPLVNISMLVDMLGEVSDEGEKNILIKKLDTTSQNLSDIFNELVESIQISQDTEIPSKKLQFDKYLQKTINGLQGQINHTGAVIEQDFRAAPILKYPPKYLYSILYNLVSNALKYHSPARKPHIRLATQKTGEGVLLSVSDNGLGIDLEKNRQHLFKIRKVFHSHPDAKGFGLFITKSQIEAMNGRIWLESKPNEGSTFFVEFKTN